MWKFEEKKCNSDYKRGLYYIRIPELNELKFNKINYVKINSEYKHSFFNIDNKLLLEKDEHERFAELEIIFY